MVSDMQDETVASELHLRKVWQLQSPPCRSGSKPPLRRVAGLDEIITYLSRHHQTVTTYGTCCGRIIVAKNWKFCPFDGTPLLDGQPVTLRSRIDDAEQRGMTEYLDDLDGQGDQDDQDDHNDEYLMHVGDGRCAERTKRGQLCRNYSMAGENMCKRHNETPTVALLDF